MFGGHGEFYLMDDLKNCLHSFENAYSLPSPATNPLVRMYYPLRQDYFSNDLSVVRSGCNLYNQLVGGLQIDVAAILKFVL
jgi:hypothetical protein